MSHVILIECSDQKGLIAKITGTIFKHNLNITGNWEFVDRQRHQFFMRTEVEDLNDIEKLREDLQLLLPKDSIIRIRANEKKKIIIMATKEAHCLGDLLTRCWHGDLNAEIQAVISNHNILKDLVNRFDLPYYFLAAADNDRTEQENQVTKVIDTYNPDYIVLAKYMRILSPNFVNQYTNKIINIHHSFLPAFMGAKPYHQAFERGVKIIGATSHFVNNNLDEGPIISQMVIPVDHSHSPSDMARAGQDVEKVTLARALRLAAEDRVFVSGNRTIVFE